MTEAKELIEDINKFQDEFIERQKEILKTSDSEIQREIAQDLIDISSGKETVDSLERKKLKNLNARWQLYLIDNPISADESILCKKCGYKRYFYKDYGCGNKKYFCPSCKGEYAIFNDDERYSPNHIRLASRIFGMFFGVLIFVYVLFALYQPSVFIPFLRGDIIEFTGLARIPAFATLICAVILFLSEVIDHYDKRNNEYLYPKIRFYSVLGFFVFFFTAAWVQFY